MIHTSRLQRAEAVRWRGNQVRAILSDLRSRVLAAIDGGASAKAVAALFQVSVSYIYKALGRREATGETEARAQRNQQPHPHGRVPVLARPHHPAHTHLPDVVCC